MIRSIRSDDQRFKSVTFGPGLNILLADKFDDQAKPADRKSAKDLRTRNGAGKSSFIDIIHFLLGGKAEGALTSAALAEWSFSGEFGSPISSLEFGVERSLVAPKVIRRLTSASSADLTVNAFLQEIGRDWFKLPDATGPGGPSFRQMMAFFARRRRDGGYDHPTRTFRVQSTQSSEVNLAHLFGLDADIVRRRHVAKAALKQTDAARKVL
ncbi:hypothetical protein LTR94_024361, partial [Friedmanniomyces endolithicus]